MVNIEGIVLYKLLELGSLSALADLKSCFFSGAYSPIYRTVKSFYTKHGRIPSFEDLKLTLRDARLLNSVHALESLEVPDVELDLAVSALIDQYAQVETLTLLDTFVDSISILDVNEIKESLGTILLELDSQLNTDELIVTSDQLSVFKRPEDSSKSRVPSGISNFYDSFVGGFYDEELILLGGKRGAGKSIVCANISAAHYEMGMITPYFTIEMTSDETFDRIMSILAEVPYDHLRKNTLAEDEVNRLAKARSGMFIEGDKHYNSFLEHNDRFKLEKELKEQDSLRPEAQIVIVDDRELSITQIDLSLQKLKAQHGNKIKTVVIDYLNQITLGGNPDSMYDWKDQVTISKQLKNLARKYKISIVSPYQIDDNGVARFAKGIQDACDVSIVLDAKRVPGSISFKCDKARNSSDEFKFRTEITWENLRIDPMEVAYDVESPDSEADENDDPKASFMKSKGRIGGGGEL
jgi:archaellum biogenesis ATPase FlaH